MKRKTKERHPFWRAILTIFGAAMGAYLAREIVDYRNFQIVETNISPDAAPIWGLGYALIIISGAILFGIIFFLLSTPLIALAQQGQKKANEKFESMPTGDIVAAFCGLLAGFVIAFLLSNLVESFPFSRWLIAIIDTVLYISFGLIGWSVARTRFGDIVRSSGVFRKKPGTVGQVLDAQYARAKVLDTSVIIDGRIFDICQTGVIEGELVICGFVLQELRHVSDSEDASKRARGRRGLEVIKQIQNELDIPVRVDETDYEDIAEVDAKLIKRAQDLGGVVLTNDYNLNKVADVQDVPVLNINELANALKPVVLPGEEMEVTVIKEGKEAEQGLAYLDDGTMIVVEKGSRYIGQTIKVEITSVLQTAVGRMIFAQKKGAPQKAQTKPQQKNGFFRGGRKNEKQKSE